MMMMMMMTTVMMMMIMMIKMAMMMMMMMICFRVVSYFLFLEVGFYGAKILISSVCVHTLNTLEILDFNYFEASDSSTKHFYV